MVDKKCNNDKAIQIKGFAQKYGLNDLDKEIENFISLNDAYKAHVLLIGGYSAGKTALLNKYIGKSVLVEGQGPQTNVATELYFSENERIIANMMDGENKILSRTDMVDVKEVRNIEYYLTSENIKQQNDYIIVDTPGFDSGIEEHNKALMQYIDRGTAFILVIDCEKGTVPDSALNFVSEVSNYSNDIAVIINKCDKKIPQEVEEIRKHIENILNISCGRDIKVITTSIYDENVSIKIKELIGTFSPQYLYEKNVTSRLSTLTDLLISSLTTIKEKQVCDTSEIDKEIFYRQKAKERLFNQMEILKKRMKTKLHNEVKEKILSKIAA